MDLSKEIILFVISKTNDPIKAMGSLLTSFGVVCETGNLSTQQVKEILEDFLVMYAEEQSKR
jgi:hypothetical protein